MSGERGRSGTSVETDNPTSLSTGATGWLACGTTKNVCPELSFYDMRGEEQ